MSKNVIITTICLITALCGCGDIAVSGRINQQSTVDKVVQEQIKASDQANMAITADAGGTTEEVEEKGQEDQTSPQIPSALMPAQPAQDAQTNQTIQNTVLSDQGSVGNAAQTIPYLTLDDIKAMSSSTDVDIDIANMEGDMVYATVLNILMDPTSFEGSTVRMKGQCVYSYNDDGSNTYANVIIADALACCAQGLEFQRGTDGEYKCPEDYPPEGSEVLVEGTLETYFEGEAMYFRIGNATVAEVTT